jgi:hypothetical protein
MNTPTGCQVYVLENPTGRCLIGLSSDGTDPADEKPDGIRAAAYLLRLPKHKWADHQMLLLESCIHPSVIGLRV